METETEQIFKEQLGKLPSEVIDFLSSSNWDTDLDEIGALYNLPEEELSNLKREVTLVLAGLVHPDEFRESLEQEVGIKGAVLEAVVSATEHKIFAPVRPALIEFFDSEARDEEKVPHVSLEPYLTPNTPNLTPVSAPRMLDVAPDNLPTGEVESLLPPIPQKAYALGTGPLNWDITPSYPFEEKMKKVFTTGQQSMGDLSLEPVAPQTPAPPPIVPPVPLVQNVPPIPHSYHADPYREEVE